MTYDVLEMDNTLFGYYFIDEGILSGMPDVRRSCVSMEEGWAYAAPLCAGFAAVYGLPPCESQIYDGYPGELIP